MADLTVNVNGTLADGAVTTVKLADDAVTFAKMQNIPSGRLIGRHTSGAGDPQDINIDGGLELNGANLRRSALTGDVTASAGSDSTTITNDAVTFAKMQNIPSDRLLGRASAGTGNVEEITCTAAGRALLDDANAAAQRVTLLPSYATNASKVLAVNSGATDVEWGDAVRSFNGRVGSVVGAQGDYDASLINNDSGVTGGTVAEALDQLNADKIQDGEILSSGLTFPNGGLLVGDVGNDRTLSIAVGDNLTADRQLQITVGNADRTLQLTGNAVLNGTNTGDQDLSGLAVKANNLSDLTDAAAARSNLGLIPELMPGFTGGTQATTTAGSFTDVNNSSFSLDANTWYELEWNFVYSAAAITTGAFFAINGTGAVDYVSGVVFYDCGVGDGDSKVFNAFNQGIALPSSRVTTNNRGLIRAIIKTSAAVSVLMRFATEVGGSAITMTEMKGFKKKM